MQRFLSIMMLFGVFAASPAWAINGATCERHCECDEEGQISCMPFSIELDCDLRCDCDDIDEGEEPSCF